MSEHPRQPRQKARSRSARKGIPNAMVNWIQKYLQSCVLHSSSIWLSLLFLLCIQWRFQVNYNMNDNRDRLPFPSLDRIDQWLLLQRLLVSFALAHWGEFLRLIKLAFNVFTYVLYDTGCWYSAPSLLLFDAERQGHHRHGNSEFDYWYWKPIQFWDNSLTGTL